MAWRAFGRGKDLVCDGLQWSIEDGTEVNLLRDPWVASAPIDCLPTFANFSQME